MRINEDKKTVSAMDILFPDIGEIVGGSQREERLEVLEKRIEKMGIDRDELWWYLDLRRFGSTLTVDLALVLNVLFNSLQV